jgi:hypothetical protein
MLTNMFVVAAALGIPISDPATWPGNAPPEYPVTLPVKNEIRGSFDLDHDARGFTISSDTPYGPGPVYRLRLTPAQRDQFNAFVAYGYSRAIEGSTVTCLCDGIATKDHRTVKLRWANLFWRDRR